MFRAPYVVTYKMGTFLSVRGVCRLAPLAGQCPGRGQYIPCPAQWLATDAREQLQEQLHVAHSFCSQTILSSTIPG